MSRFKINSSYFMHSNPEYNKKHKEEISKYNAQYYEEHKEKWADNKKKDDEDEEEKKKETSESEAESEKDSKDDKKSGGSGSKEKKMPVLNGGSKKGGSPTGKKKSASNKSSSKKDEEKTEEEKAEEERKLEESRQNTKEFTDELNKHLLAYSELVKQQNKKKTVKHSAVYVGINKSSYIEHHGRLGMKWGKKNGPPYPLDYSKLSPEERAKDKTRVKEEGDIESVAYKKNRSYFSDQEINDVINRYQLNTRINQLSADSAKMKAGKSKTQELAENMQKISDVGNKLSNALNAGTNVYNNVAKIMNAFGDSDLPIIGQQKQRKEFKATKKELDKMIENLEDNMGKMSNQDLQDALKRKTMFDNLTKDRDAKKAAEQAEADAKTEKAREEYGKINSGLYSKASNFVKDNLDRDVEHVTGEVVDSGQDWTKQMLYLEDKKRR